MTPRMGDDSLKSDRRIVVVNDSENQAYEDVAHRVSPVKVILWSQREKLVSYVLDEGRYRQKSSSRDFDCNSRLRICVRCKRDVYMSGVVFHEIDAQS
jgi:hypothetical protein